jgi:DNA-directed RNA polymerase II subunit RPB1
VEARAELELLSATKYNIISPQASKPNIAIVQDSLLGAYKMTLGNTSLKRHQFFDICMQAHINGQIIWSQERMEIVKKVLKKKTKPPCECKTWAKSAKCKICRKTGKKINLYNGRTLFSLLLPEDFIYEKRNNAHPTQHTVKIYRGVMYSGTLDKSIIGASHNSIIQVIHKEYGVDVCSEFIGNIQFITNHWLLVHGFSVGLQDCLITSKQSVEKIQDKISKCYIEAEGIKKTTRNPRIREVRITASLSKAKDVGMRIAKESMAKKNNLLSTVGSGSKGDFFNIAQLTGLLGQQNLLGRRVIPTLNHGTRTLPHYPLDGKMPMEKEYECKGFVRHSFIEGLNPQEFYFHAMSGREGICDKLVVSQTGGCLAAMSA